MFDIQYYGCVDNLFEFDEIEAGFLRQGWTSNKTWPWRTEQVLKLGPLINIYSIFHLNKKVMAIVTNSYLGTFTGRIGNMVIYPLAGQIVARTIGKSYKKPTNNQLNSRMALKKMNVFYRKSRGFSKSVLN